jgi:cytochrome bd-type quinol oxidase subunit 2
MYFTMAITLALVIGIATAAWWVALLRCANNTRLTRNEKVTWVLIIVCLPMVGALLYFMTHRSRRKESSPAIRKRGGPAPRAV